MNTLPAGTLVTLKSGGPWMTVYNHTDEKVLCVWFVEGVRHRGAFDFSTLAGENGKLEVVDTPKTYCKRLVAAMLNEFPYCKRDVKNSLLKITKRNTTISNMTDSEVERFITEMEILNQNLKTA